MYNDVLSLASANEGGVIDWSKVFEDENIYKQIYKQEIIVAVMEASKTGGDSKRVMFVEEQKLTTTTYATQGTGVGAAGDEEEKKADADAT